METQQTDSVGLPGTESDLRRQVPIARYASVPP